MLDIQEIKDGVQLAAQEYPIKKAELFGSYANGTNRPDSDVDLFAGVQVTAHFSAHTECNQVPAGGYPENGC